MCRISLPVGSTREEPSVRRIRRHDIAFAAIMASLLGTIIHQVVTGLQIY